MDSALVKQLITSVFLFAGVVVSSKFTKNAQMMKLDARLDVLYEKFEALTKSVNKHNSVIERTYQLEKEVAVLKAKEEE